MNQLARMVLMAYPRQFRRAYGIEWARTVRDMQIHSGYSTLRLAGVLVREALSTAIRMRWENLVARSKTALTILVAVVVLVALAMGSEAIMLLVLAGLGLVGLQYAGKDRPISTTSLATGRWYLWLAGAAVAFVVGFGALATDGDNELNSLQWGTWMMSWAAAAVLGAIGLTLGAIRLVSNRA